MKLRDQSENTDSNKNSKKPKIENIKNTVSPIAETVLEQYRQFFITNHEISNEELSRAIISKPASHWKYSGVNRLPSAVALGYRLLPDTTDTIIALYKIKDIQETDKEVTYNVAYIESIHKKKKTSYLELVEKVQGIKLKVSENIFISSICPSGSMISKDGEYRSGIVDWNSFQVVLEKNTDVRHAFMSIVDYFNDVLKERKYVLLIEYFFPTDPIRNKYRFETEALCTTTKIEFFSIVWYNFFYGYYFNFISNHLNNTFKNLLLKYKKEDLNFFLSLWKKFSHSTLETLRYICGNYLGPSSEPKLYNKSKVGQKIIPLNLIEAQNFFNIEYSPWKEFFINTKTSDLVLNGVTGGFSLANSWFIIKNPDKYFYDNPSQADRLEKSKIALKIAEFLSHAKIYTYGNINKEGKEPLDFNLIEMALHNAEEKGNITSWLSNEFKILYTKIQDSINHTKEKIIMSNVSLCLITEFLGKTLFDAIFLTKQSSYYKNLVPSIFAPENYVYFRKYMFQLCYGIYCLNAKMQIIHGDLHLNNMTLNSIFYKKHVNVEIKNPKVLYIIDKNNQFMFDTNFYDLCIIDFSRAILHPDNYESFKLDNLPYDIVHSKTQFLNKQTKDLLAYLYASKPEFKEFGASIETPMLHHYAEYFKILTVLDIYNLTSKFIDFLKTNQYVKNPHRESIKLITELNKSSEYYLTIVFNKLITERNFEEVQSMEWPMLSIIKEIFAPDKAEHFADNYNDIVDVYNFDNPLNYSLTCSKRYPPWLKDASEMIDYLPNNKILNGDVSTDFRKKYEEKTLQNFQVINIIMKRQLEKNL